MAEVLQLLTFMSYPFLASLRKTFNAGLNINYKIDDHLAIHSGVNYLRQGYRHGLPGRYGRYFEIADLDCALVPVDAAITPFKGLTIATGIYGGYNFKYYRNYLYDCIQGSEDMVQYLPNQGLTYGLRYSNYH